MAITQEVNIEMLEKLPDGNFKKKNPTTKAGLVKFGDGTTVESHKTDVAQQLSLKADKTQSPWIIATLQNGWTSYFRYRKNSLGQLELWANLKVGTAAFGTIITVLPVGYRPESTCVIPLLSMNDNKTYMIYISANGEVKTADVFVNGNICNGSAIVR